MAKKKLILSEDITRRFMKLAEIDTMHSDTFMTEAEDDMMDPVGGAPEPGMGEEGAPPDLGAEEPEPEDMEAEEGGGEQISLDAEAFVGDIVDLLQQHGADVELDTGDEEAAPEAGPEEDAPMDAAAEAPAEEEEEVQMMEATDDLVNEVARRVSKRLLDAVRLNKATK